MNFKIKYIEHIFNSQSFKLKKLWNFFNIIDHLYFLYLNQKYVKKENDNVIPICKIPLKRFSQKR